MKVISRFNSPGFIRGKVYNVEVMEKIAQHIGYRYKVTGEDGDYAYNDDESHAPSYLFNDFEIMPDDYVLPTGVNISEVPEEHLIEELIRRGTIMEIDIFLVDTQKQKTYLQVGNGDDDARD